MEKSKTLFYLLMVFLGLVGEQRGIKGNTNLDPNYNYQIQPIDDTNKNHIEIIIFLYSFYRIARIF